MVEEGINMAKRKVVMREKESSRVKNGVTVFKEESSNAQRG
jgi:hypothetical protein